MQGADDILGIGFVFFHRDFPEFHVRITILLELDDLGDVLLFNRSVFYQDFTEPFRRIWPLLPSDDAVHNACHIVLRLPLEAEGPAFYHRQAGKCHSGLHFGHRLFHKDAFRLIAVSGQFAEKVGHRNIRHRQDVQLRSVKAKGAVQERFRIRHRRVGTDDRGHFGNFLKGHPGAYGFEGAVIGNLDRYFVKRAASGNPGLNPGDVALVQNEAGLRLRGFPESLAARSSPAVPDKSLHLFQQRFIRQIAFVPGVQYALEKFLQKIVGLVQKLDQSSTGFDPAFPHFMEQVLHMMDEIRRPLEIHCGGRTFHRMVGPEHFTDGGMVLRLFLKSNDGLVQNGQVLPGVVDIQAHHVIHSMDPPFGGACQFFA